MIGYKTSPTRANLIRFKQELKLAHDGYELLDKKREVLLRELFRLIFEIKNLQEVISQKLPQIYEKFQVAETKLGRERMKNILNVTAKGREIRLLEKSVMGIHMPEVHLQEELKSSYYGPVHTPPELDETIKLLTEIFPTLLHYLELKYALVRVAQEVKRTERRLRALENIFIPEYKSDIVRIETYLEESEREEFFRTKKVKYRIARRNV
ncbi:MAG: V-type ATP synthase subunit D [Candidatus Omnitrophica bacterium]|nr:V-type ATP synthase subunit D [Candidatus Omnitrophota bacterium]